MNKPQLSEPLLTINQFDDTVSGKSFREWRKWNDLSHAQALQDQREGYIAEVEKLKKTGDSALGWVELSEQEWGYNGAINRVLDILKGKTE